MTHSPLKTIKYLLNALGTVWCMVGVCVIAVLVVEFGLRLTFHIRDAGDEQYRISNRPLVGPSGHKLPSSVYTSYWIEYQSSKRPKWQSHVYWRRPPYEGKYINVDSDGLRRTWIDQNSRSNARNRQLRVFVFGGSTTWGTGARDDYTIPSFLAKLLNENGIAAEVLNFGEGGYVSTQEVIGLILRLQMGDIPDAVVFYDGYNDAFSAFQNGVAGIPQNEGNRREEFNLLRDRYRLWQTQFKQLPGELKGFNRLATAVRNRMGMRSALRQQKSWNIELASDVARVYDSNIKLVEALADSYGFSSHFFWQPIIYTKRKLTEAEVGYANELSSDARKFFLAVYERARKFESLQQNQHFKDISAIFDARAGVVYIDYAHVTEEANSMIAKRIAESLIPAIRQKSAIDADRLSHAR